MSTSTAEQLATLHRSFVKNFIRAARFDPYAISILPSVLFLTFSFILLYRIIHRRSISGTPARMFFFREMGFQWSYFYTARLWLIIVKFVKLTAWFIEEYFKDSYLATRRIWYSPKFIHSVAFFMLNAFGAIPLCILVVNYLFKEAIPNFMIWVGEDPWLRTEIGLAGHYLERPPPIYNEQPRITAYRSHRSTSVENAKKRIDTLRQCRSLEALNGARSSDTLLD